MNFSLSLFAPENLISRHGFGSPVPRQLAHPHTQAESDAYLWDSSRVPRRRPFIYLNRHTSSGQFRVYRVTQLRTDGVHCRESAGTGPVNLKVVPVTGAALAGPHGPIKMRLSFPHPLLVWRGHVESIYITAIIILILIHVCVCVCVFFPFILDIKFVGRTSRGHTGGRSHRISHPPSFCGACLNFSREKDSAIPFPRRP